MSGSIRYPFQYTDLTMSAGSHVVMISVVLNFWRYVIRLQVISCKCVNGFQLLVLLDAPGLLARIVFFSAVSQILGFTWCYVLLAQTW